MTQRVPLAVVATAMPDQVVRASALPGAAQTPQSADYYWSAKKRKRTVRREGGDVGRGTHVARAADDPPAPLFRVRLL